MKRTLIPTIILSITLGLLAPMSSFAVAPADNRDIETTQFSVGKILTLPGIQQPTAYLKDDKYGPVTAFILYIINFATRIIGSLAIIMFIISGFMFMFAQGNQQKIDNAKEVIKYAIIGLIATFLAYLIIIFVQSLFIANGK